MDNRFPSSCFLPYLLFVWWLDNFITLNDLHMCSMENHFCQPVFSDPKQIEEENLETNPGFVAVIVTLLSAALVFPVYEMLRTMSKCHTKTATSNGKKKLPLII